METFYKLERSFYALEAEKYKLDFPQFFDYDEVRTEIDRLNHEVTELEKYINTLNGLEMKKDLMSMQLSEYINKLEKHYPLSFSRSQGFIGNHYFYTKPYSDIKNILFNDFKGIMGVSLFLTNDESDAVMNKEDFKHLLEEIRTDINRCKNMSQLFHICEEFIKKIKHLFK